MKYIGTAVLEKQYVVEAVDEADARTEIMDIAEEEFPDADIYLAKEIEVFNG